MQSRIVTGPAYWACALINGDHTGMSDAEDKLCAAWLVNELEPLEEVVDVVEDSERFTWSYRLYGGDAAGGDVCDYVVLGPKAGV